MVVLSEFEIITGIATLIFLIISMSVAIKIASKYFEIKSKSLLFIGLAFLGLYFHYIPVVINVIYVYLTGELLSVEFNLLLGFGILPIFTILWYLGFTELTFQENRKIIMIVIVSWSIIFYIIFFYFLFTDVSALAVVVNAVKMKFEVGFALLLLSSLLLWQIPGYIFSIRGVRSDNPIVKMKGKFLLLTFIIYPIGAFFDLISEDDVLLIILARIIGIISAFTFYIGMVLPEWAKKILLSEK